MCSACRFCFSVYLLLSPRGMSTPPRCKLAIPAADGKKPQRPRGAGLRRARRAPLPGPTFPAPGGGSERARVIRLDNISRQHGKQILFVEASAVVHRGEHVG